MARGFKIEVKSQQVLAKLSKMGDAASNLSAPMNEIGIFMERELKLGFARGTDPDGAGWASLKPSTLARKRGGSILRETSTLMGGIAAQGATNNSVRVQSTAGSEYGIFHQSGTSVMAQRKYMGIGAQHVPKIRKIVYNYILNAI